MKLKDYIGGHRRGREANLLEREALNDPLLAEALEGFETVEGDHEQVISRLRDNVSERAALERALYRRTEHRSRRRIALAGAVAACVLVLGGGLLLVLRHNPDAWMDGAAVVIPREVDEVTLGELLHNRHGRPSTGMLTDSAENILVADHIDMDMLPAREIAAPEAALSEHAVQTEILAVVQDLVADEDIVVAEIDEARVGNVYTARSEGSIALTKAETQTDSVVAAVTREAGKESAAGSISVVAAGTTSRAQKDADVLSALGSLDASIRIVEQADSVAHAEFDKYVGKNILPQKDSGGKPVSGKVVAEFRVNRRGRPTGIKVLESPAVQAEGEARRLIRSGPDWPVQNGTVRVEIEFAP